MDLQVQFVAVSMDGCGHVTALPRAVYDQRREDHQGFWCSTCGRENYFPRQSDLELALEAQARAEEQAKSAERRAQYAENSLRVTRGHLTRIKRRIAAGVCPCCKRSFRDLARHMTGQRPGYAGEGD